MVKEGRVRRRRGERLCDIGEASPRRCCVLGPGQPPALPLLHGRTEGSASGRTPRGCDSGFVVNLLYA